ncbi:MAG TPA: 4-hydroxy-tetrahydrodipicolinate reductase [Armatimonadota bacterium]|jgi:4-hydroxy-tetrahydrodipicolinate reductase
MANKLKVLVTGAAGRMGREVVRAISAEADMEVVAAIDPSFAAANPDTDAGVLAGVGRLGVDVQPGLSDALYRTTPDVVVDFTQPASVMDNLRLVLGDGVNAVVGTTGLTDADLTEIRQLCSTNDARCLVAPNFAIGAVLMMQFVKAAARHMPDCEIIEMHHNKKLDAPSGTAMKTAEIVAAARTGASPDATQKVILEGARGGDFEGIKVHSIRMPGFVASQEVIFGGQGQTLTIRHDTLDRSSFMPGVVLGIRRIGGRSGLVYGLDALLET